MRSAPSAPVQCSKKTTQISRIGNSNRRTAKIADLKAAINGLSRIDGVVTDSMLWAAALQSMVQCSAVARPTVPRAIKNGETQQQNGPVRKKVKISLGEAAFVYKNGPALVSESAVDREARKGRSDRRGRPRLLGGAIYSTLNGG